MTPTALSLAARLGDWRQRMCAGERINVSEQRAVLHMALRGQAGQLCEAVAFFRLEAGTAAQATQVASAPEPVRLVQ